MIERLGTRQMRVLRGVEDLKAYEQGLNNTTTAADLALILDALYNGEAAPPEATREMIDIMRGLEDNAMIPAGLPPGAQAAHKTGTITAINHDAAIVYPAEGAPYVLVILTEGIEETEASAALGAEIARAVHQALRGSGSSG
jgi:beta-lactamase class A